MSAGVPRATTRERILRAAEVVLGECGYHGTRLHDIASRVGIRKASLFHYFPSKEDLHHAVMEEWFGEIEQVIRRELEGSGTPLEKVRSLAETYVDMVMAHPDRTKILLRQSLGDAPASHWPQEPQRLLRIVSDFIAESQKAKMIAPIDPHALVLSVVAMVAFFSTSAPVLAPRWFGDPSNAESIKRVKRHVVELMDRCLAVESQPRPAPSKRAVV